MMPEKIQVNNHNIEKWMNPFSASDNDHYHCYDEDSSNDIESVDTILNDCLSHLKFLQNPTPRYNCCSTGGGDDKNFTRNYQYSSSSSCSADEKESFLANSKKQYNSINIGRMENNSKPTDELLPSSSSSSPQSSSSASSAPPTSVYYPSKLIAVSHKKFTRRNNFLLIIYFIIYGLFLIAGAFLFHQLESPKEELVRNNLKNRRNDFLKKYPFVLDDDLEEFITEIIKANERGISALRNTSSELNWSFGQALFFSSTVVTTIGYGHVTPLSETGKLFCMLYAIIGIPLTLVLLSAVVERLLVPANWLLGALNSKLGHLYQPFNIRLLHLTIIIFIIGVLFFLIPTFVFAYLEPTWGLLDAFYYCFISLTTIGLGDFIPGDSPDQINRSLYKAGTTCYLIFGLIGIMLTLTVFYDIPQLNLGQLFTENGTGCDSEKLRLSGNNAPCYSGPSGLYIPQRDEDVRRAVVKIRPRGDDSPSPEDTTPMHARDIRVP